MRQLGQGERLRSSGLRRRGSRPGAGNGKEGKREAAGPASRPGRLPGQEREGGRAESGVGLEMKKESFSNLNSFRILVFKSQAKFQSISSIVSNILPYSNKNGQFC